MTGITQIVLIIGVLITLFLVWGMMSWLMSDRIYKKKFSKDDKLKEAERKFIERTNNKKLNEVAGKMGLDDFKKGDKKN
jgi:hypothetical protein